MRHIFDLDNIRSDKEGDGHYGASRGSRKHVGIDFIASANEPVPAPISGVITKLGYPYGDDLSYRYVQITDDAGKRVRCFYVEPSVRVGDSVRKGDQIGTVQTLQKRYGGRGMVDHVHLEVKTGPKQYEPWPQYLNTQVS